MTTLKKEDKIQLIEGRARGLDYKRYGLEIDLIVENAKTTPDQDAIAVINSAIDEIDTQLLALNSELATVNALAE